MSNYLKKWGVIVTGFIGNPRIFTRLVTALIES